MNDALNVNLRRYREALGRVRSDRDLSEEARRRLLGEAYSEASANYTRLVGEERQQAGRVYGDAARSVFGPPMPHGTAGAERVAVQASYRDALFRVSGVGVEDSDQLHRLQSMAAATGDKLLQRAVLYRGYELEDRGVVEAVTTAEPEIGRAWESFMDAAEGLNAAEDPLSPMAMAAPEPPSEIATPSTAAAV